MAEPTTAAETDQDPRNVCCSGGYLAAVGEARPADPSDHDARGLPVRGCNRLRCQRCLAWVRHVVNVRAGAVLTKAELAARYEQPGPDAAWLPSPVKSRLSFCRCHYHEASESPSFFTREDEPDPSDATPVALVQPDWQCAGHPLCRLPCEVDGVALSPQNLSAVTLQALRGQLPRRTATVEQGDGLWVARLYVRLAQTPLQQVVATTALCGLTDAVPQARAAAMDCLSILDLPDAREQGLALLQGDRALFAGVPDPTMRAYRPATLEHKLWRLVQPLLAQPGTARTLAQQDALSPGRWNETIYSVLVRTEPDWVADRMDDLLRANPDGTPELLKAVQRAALNSDSESSTARLREAVRAYAQEQVLKPGGGNKDLYALLASLSPAWLVAQLETIVAASPTDLSQLSDALRGLPAYFDAAARKAAHEQLTQLARKRVLTPGQGSASLYTQLAHADPQWFAENLDLLVAENPRDLVAIVQAIRPRVPDAAVKLAQRWLNQPGAWDSELYRLLVRDQPQWFATHAEALARQNPGSIPALIRAINDFPSRLPQGPALRTTLQALADSLGRGTER